MNQGNRPMYAATVAIYGEGQEIGGGMLIGCSADPTIPLNFGYVLNRCAYPVTGTPDTSWSVTINGNTYTFPASEQGQSWTAEQAAVAVVPIQIYGVSAGESPGDLIYWPVGLTADGTFEPPTAGSTGVYHDVNQHYHTVEFRTTWSVPDLLTTFTWTSTSPFSGPYTARPDVTPMLGDGDTWVGGDPAPGTGDPDGGGTE